MDIKTIVLIFCVVDIILGFWCLFLSLQGKEFDDLKKKGNNKNGK